MDKLEIRDIAILGKVCSKSLICLHGGGGLVSNPVKRVNINTLLKNKESFVLLVFKICKKNQK